MSKRVSFVIGTVISGRFNIVSGLVGTYRQVGTSVTKKKPINTRLQ